MYEKTVSAGMRTLRFQGWTRCAFFIPILDCEPHGMSNAMQITININEYVDDDGVYGDGGFLHHSHHNAYIF